MLVDAFWPANRLVVELDGAGAHGTSSRIRADRARDMSLRRAGYSVIRYSYWQVTEQPDAIAAELRAALT